MRFRRPYCAPSWRRSYASLGAIGTRSTLLGELHRPIRRQRRAEGGLLPWLVPSTDEQASRLTDRQFLRLLHRRTVASTSTAPERDYADEGARLLRATTTDATSPGYIPAAAAGTCKSAIVNTTLKSRRRWNPVARSAGHINQLKDDVNPLQIPTTFARSASGASSRGQRRFARSSPTTTPRPRPDFSDRAGTSDGPTPTRAARTEAAPCCRILGADAQAQAAACALDEQQRPIADSSFARMRDSRGSSGSQASCDVAASVDVVAVAVTSSDASPLLLVLTRSGAAVDAGGCSAAGATARCACKPQRMGPPASGPPPVWTTRLALCS